MAFWIQKPGEAAGITEENEKKAGPRQKSKDKQEDKKTTIKRIDNLRIPERLRIHLKSFGTQTTYAFMTKDLSATGVFVLCQNFTSYPFQPTSTLIEATIELVDPITGECKNLDFVARIARVVEAHGTGAALISGFGLRIIQMDFSHRQYLENFIASYGKPDLSASGSSSESEDLGPDVVTTNYGPAENSSEDATDDEVSGLDRAGVLSDAG